MTTNTRLRLAKCLQATLQEPHIEEDHPHLRIISGILSSVMMCGTIPFLRDLNHGNKGYYLGYTAIVLSFLLVFFGIRSYRDNLANGGLPSARAFAIGIGITLISCVFYVVTWEIIYFNFLHGFMDSYFAKLIEKAQSSPGTARGPSRPKSQLSATRSNSMRTPWSTPSTPS